MKSIFRLIENDRSRRVDYIICHLFSSMNRETVHEYGVLLGFRHQFFVNLDEEEGWIYFTINPFVPSPDPECQDNLCRHLVYLNYDLTMAKFVIDDEGDVALTVELPAKDLAYSHFAAAIAALSKAAGENYDEVLNLSQDTTAVSSYE